MRRGRASLVFEHPPVIEAAASVAGKKEGEGPLRGRFDLVAEDDRMGKKTWEEAESAMQEAACRLALKKGGLERGQIQYLFAGISWGSSSPPPSGWRTWKSRCLACTGPAPPSGKPCAWGP